MPRTTNGLLAAASFCGAIAFASCAFAQSVDVEGPTAGPTAKTLSGVTSNGDNPKAGIATPVAKPDPNAKSQVPDTQAAVIVPKPDGGAGNMAPLNGDESGVALSANTENAGPAARSAESTAHKTVYDPNNQLGTSLEGKTTPQDTASK
jgi:hypothetical protein